MLTTYNSEKKSGPLPRKKNKKCFSSSDRKSKFVSESSNEILIPISNRSSVRSVKKYRPPMSRKVTRTESCNSRKTQSGMRKINQYFLIEKLGVGAYGDVFKAIEPSKDNHPLKSN